MKKMLFVFNPKSGKGQLAPDLMEVLNIFAGAGYQITVHPTRQTLDAYETIRDQAADYDLLVLSGGDGTLNECVRGMMAIEPVRRPVIGYIPSGTINDFAASHRISRNAIGAARDIVSGRQFTCDIGEFQDSYFSYVAAFGAFTDVAYDTPQSKKNALGHLAYLIEGAKRLPSLKAYHLTVETDDASLEGDFILGMVTNTTSVGGFPLKKMEVSLTDGLCELLLVKASTSVKNLTNLLSAVALQDFSSEHLVYLKTKHATITFDQPTPWTLDGEFGGNHRVVKIRNHQNALTFMVSRNAGENAPPEMPATPEK